MPELMTICITSLSLFSLPERCNLLKWHVCRGRFHSHTAMYLVGTWCVCVGGWQGKEMVNNGSASEC